MGRKTMQEEVARVVSLPTVLKLTPDDANLHTQSNRGSWTWLLFPFALPILTGVIENHHYHSHAHADRTKSI